MIELSPCGTFMQIRRERVINNRPVSFNIFIETNEFDSFGCKTKAAYLADVRQKSNSFFRELYT